MLKIRAPLYEVPWIKSWKGPNAMKVTIHHMMALPLFQFHFLSNLIFNIEIKRLSNKKIGQFRKQQQSLQNFLENSVYNKNLRQETIKGYNDQGRFTFKTCKGPEN